MPVDDHRVGGAVAHSTVDVDRIYTEDGVRRRTVPRVPADESGWHLTKLPPREQARATSGYVRVLRHEPLGDRYMILRLHAPRIAAVAQPGQFSMLTAARRARRTPTLPRPMAIYAVDSAAGDIEIIYGVVGSGTKLLQQFRSGDDMYAVGPLGRGFDIPCGTRRVLLVGRGIGVCSLTTVAQHTADEGISTVAVVSARTPEALIGVDFYRDHGAEVYAVTDEDGTSVPDALVASLTHDLDAAPPQVILTCGSDRLARMCERLADRWSATVQVSVEAHMACGLGYCHGCASGAPSKSRESPLICYDGPVFRWAPPAEEGSQ